MLSSFENQGFRLFENRFAALVLAAFFLVPGCGYMGVESLDRPSDGGGSDVPGEDTGTEEPLPGTDDTSFTDPDAGSLPDTSSEADAGMDTSSESGAPGDTEDTNSGAESPTDTSTSFGDSESAAEPETDTAVDTATGMDTESMPTTDTDSQTSSDTGTEGDTDTDSNTETDTDGELDSASATEAPTDTDTPTDTEAPTDTDTPTDTEESTETEIDTCPPVPEGEPVMGALSSWQSFGYATVTLETVEGPGFTQAWRCARAGEALDPTASQLLADTVVDIEEGDTLLATFWVRCLGSASGVCRTGFIFEQSASPWANGAEYYLTADSEWTMHQVPFVSPQDFAAGGAHGTFRLDYDDQTIEIYPADIVNFGNLTEAACLPASPGIFGSIGWVSVPETIAVADLKYSYRLEFNGKPAPVVTVTGLPPWLTFNGTRLISGAPPYTALGLTDVISIEIANESGSATQEFQIEVIVDPHLEAHWPLDETSGEVAHDASGNGNDGALAGDPVWIPDEGHVGGALRFNGYDGLEDYVEIPSGPVLDDVQEGDYTLAAWVRPNSAPQGEVETDNDAAFGILVKNGDHLGLWYENDERFHGAHYFESGPIEASSGVNAPGDYHHVAMRVNTTLGYMHLYVDGSYQQGRSFTPGAPVLEYADALWRIGIGYPGAAERGMISDADIDDVRIYSRSLSEAEIRTLAGWD